MKKERKGLLRQLVNNGGVQAHMNGVNSEISVFKDGQLVAIRRVDDIVADIVKQKAHQDGPEVMGQIEPSNLSAMSTRDIVAEAMEEKKSPEARAARNDRIRTIMDSISPRYKAAREMFASSHPKSIQNTIAEVKKELPLVKQGVSETEPVSATTFSLTPGR